MTREPDLISQIAERAFALYERGELDAPELVSLLESCVNARTLENGYADRYGLPFPAKPTPETRKP